MSDPLRSIDLNLLYTYFVVVESGGVGRAATHLGRSQPAVTSRLKLLEDALGAPLLLRAGRGVQPTMLGRAVLEDIRAIVERARSVVDTARSGAAEPSGTFRLGTLPMIGAHLLAPALAELAAVYPRVDFELRPAFITEQLDELRRGRIDVALTVGRPEEPGITSEQLGVVRAVLVEPAASAARGPARSIGTGDVIGYGGVTDPFFEAIQRYLDRHAPDAHIRFRVPHIPTIKALVRAGAGVALLPDYTIVEPDLVARRLRGLDVAEPLTALFRPGIRALPLVDGVFTRLRDALRSRDVSKRRTRARDA